MNRNSILVCLCAAAISGLGGCGSSSSGGSAPPPPPSVSIAFQPAPPPSMTIISTAQFAATVSNDSLDLGVDWVLNCSVSGPQSCGLLNNKSETIHTASGATVTYQPPTGFPTNTETVYIGAFATSDRTKNVVAPISVSGFAGNLQGTYVFSVKGTENASGLPFALAGAFVADGNGNITGGELTYTSALGTFSDPILSSGSSYTINPDGTGIVLVNTGDQNLPGDQGPGVEQFSLVLISAPQGPQALISQFLQHFSSGTLELQGAIVAPSGGYAFAVEGMTVAIDPNSFSQDPLIFGGVFNVDSAGTISGNGSVADEVMGVTNSDGSTTGVIVNQATLAGTVSAPDSMGAVTINLASTFAPIIQLTGYIVDATHMQLLESDNTQGVGFGITGGVAISQGSATGSFHNNSALAGPFVYGIYGQVPLFTLPGFDSLTGLFTADGAGSLTNGFTDQFYLSSFGFTQISDTLTGTYSVDNSGTGRGTATTNFVSNGTGPTLIFYLVGTGKTPLLLNMDMQTMGAGTAYPQQATAFSFSGPYGFYDASLAGDLVGNFTADATQNTIAGIIWSGSANSFTGSFTGGSGPSSRVTGSLSGGISEPEVAIYPIDSDRGLFTEIDGSQAALGYFAVQTPLCPSCLGAIRWDRHSMAVRPVRTPRSPHTKRR